MRNIFKIKVRKENTNLSVLKKDQVSIASIFLNKNINPKSFDSKSLFYA